MGNALAGFERLFVFNCARQTFFYCQTHFSREMSLCKKNSQREDWPNRKFITLKDASDSLAKRGSFLRKEKRSILKLQKWVLELWRWTSGQKASILFKAYVGVHFTTVRSPLRPETAPPPKVQLKYLKFASVWDRWKSAERARKCAHAHVDTIFEI